MQYAINFVECILYIVSIYTSIYLTRGVAVSFRFSIFFLRQKRETK